MSKIHNVQYNDVRGTARNLEIDMEDMEGFAGIIERVGGGIKSYRKTTGKKPHYVTLDHPSYIALQFLLHISQGRENEPLTIFIGVRVLINFKATKEMIEFACKPGIE